MLKYRKVDGWASEVVGDLVIRPVSDLEVRWVRTAIALSLILALAGFLPAASSYHLSVGNQDAVGIQPTETPANPSVCDDRPSCVEAGAPDQLARGLGQGCTPHEADGSVESAQASVGADTFCGRLMYNEDPEISGEFVQASPADQTYFGPITQFDVIYASYVGDWSLSYSCPWCLNQASYQAIHDAGHMVGLTDDGDTAWSGDQGWYEAAANMLYPNAMVVAQQETGAWEMNGWVHTIHDQQFIGFLTATINGQEITLDQDGLDALVEGEDMGTVDDPSDDVDLDGDGTISSQGLKDQGLLAEEATAQVCAFTPEVDVDINAPQATFCEVIFQWAEEDPDRDPTSARGSYSDPCDSPAYMCGVLTPAWYASLVCKQIPYTSSGSGCGDYPGPNADDAPAWSDNDYDIWHFVVAPSPSDCNTAQEPGFLFDTGATYPYLAHDLDVYSPASSAADASWTAATGQDVQANVDFVGDTADAAQDDGLGTVLDLVDLPEEVVDTTYMALKDDIVEPNAPGDTSQSLAGALAGTDDPALVRAIGQDPCRAFNPSDETAETIDPWVDYLDSQTLVDAGAGELYLNTDRGQDASNRAGPGQFYTSGFVGMFTDINDDGEYDQAGGDSLFEAIQSVGAYPLFWDLWAKEDDSGQVVPDPDGGCKATFGDKKLTENMVAAGYGLHTGLLQVVYLQEPTYMYSWLKTEATPYIDGNRVFVFMSQGLHTLLENGTAAQQTQVAGYINDALELMPASVTIRYDPAMDADLDEGVTVDDRVEFPARELGHQSDWSEQCGSATGDFLSEWGFFHDGTVLDASDDTVVTEYIFEVTTSDGTLGDGNLVAFKPNNEVYSFGQGIHQWFDVDPLDNDPSRNQDYDSAPPT